jgi:hypothetical protein
MVIICEKDVCELKEEGRDRTTAVYILTTWELLSSSRWDNSYIAIVSWDSKTYWVLKTTIGKR